MTSKNQHDQYVAKAEEARAHADKTKDPKIEHAWRQIAARYHDLAMMAQYSGRKRRV